MSEKNYTIISPDTQKKNRVPNGQRLTDNFPVLHFNSIHEFNRDKWVFRIWGQVEKEKRLPYNEFISLPQVKVFSDIHCVTGWSKLNNTWQGISSKEIKNLVRIKPEAKFVMIYCSDDYYTNLACDDFFADDVLFAVKLNGQDITPEHGHPVRLVVPRLYFWKSAKWVNGVQFLAKDVAGFWESRGYHNHGDPWREQRYS
ncbi:MAG: sulfite oxidase-like oxidoreductase [Candidatus Latescibacteria bacterium]|nr:sulfite oxidase-like oxidoreductase [Candidatus Latescibacterota bacterium]